MFVSYSALVAGLADDTLDDATRSASFAVGLAVTPFVFVVLAFGSRHRRAPRAVLLALGAWILVAVSSGWFSVGLGLAFAYGVGGMIALRADHTGAARLRALALMSALLYTLILAAMVSAAVGLFAAAIIPLMALGFADQYLDYRQRS